MNERTNVTAVQERVQKVQITRKVVEVVEVIEE